MTEEVPTDLPPWDELSVEKPQPKTYELPEWNPSPDQAAAWDRMTSWVKNPGNQLLFVLGGLGGTGKTFLTSRLALWLLNEGIRVVYAAPTGKAVLVIRNNFQKVGLQEEDITVRTVHGTIYRPQEDLKTGRIIAWVERGEPDYDLIVVDEFSMVAAPELEALKRLGKPILAVGDHGQLSPVGEDTGVMKNPDVRLERIHRLAHGNPIIRLAHMVRRGAPDYVLKEFIDHAADPRLTWSSDINDAIEKGKNPGVILTFTNKMRRNLNNMYREQVLDKDEYDPLVKGESVICLKNKRFYDTGLFIPNGMRGVVTSEPEVTQHYITADVMFDDPVGLVQGLRMCRHQFLREKTFAGYDEIPGNATNWNMVGLLADVSYAITAHKAQGSGYENVAVVVERALGVLEDDERKRWLYTAFSRSADRLHVVFT